MVSDRLADWLRRLESRSPESRIELGLERVSAVRQRLAPDLSGMAVISVAGTNGKGSVVAYLEQIALAAGRSCLAYSSPHLVEFGERMRLNGCPAQPDAMADALAAVEACREDVFLTYFEHITLAALWLAARARVELLILEVGLGGRLDAVNVVDADVAVLTSIGLDHTDWLGRTRLKIGIEKAGIARSGRPFIVGERRLPRGFDAVLRDTGADVALAGRDFRWRRTGQAWTLRSAQRRLSLPRPAMTGGWQLANAACALAALLALGPRFPVTDAELAAGLTRARLPGRLQKVADQPDIWLDVAHNPAAARELAAALGRAQDRSVAIFGALADKDIAAILRVLDPCFSHWLMLDLPVDRALAAERLAAVAAALPVAGAVEQVKSADAALARARALAGRQGRIIVFGSFRTVAAAWPHLQTN